MTSVASPIKDFSIHSSDDISFKSISSLERHAMRYQSDVERFVTPSLSRQRVTVDADKEQEQANLAVCAKIEKAIGRRLSLQDAVFTKKPKSQSALPPPLAKEMPKQPFNEKEKK